MPKNWWEMYPEVVPSPFARPRPLPGPGGAMPGPAMGGRPYIPSGTPGPAEGASGVFDPSSFSGTPVADDQSPGAGADQAPIPIGGGGSAVNRDIAIQQAGAAIQRGADPDAVRARLHAMGHSDVDPPSAFSDLIPDDAKAPGMTGASATAMPAERQTSQDQSDFDKSLYPLANPQQYRGSLERRSDAAMAPQMAGDASRHSQSKMGSQVTNQGSELGSAIPRLISRSANPTANAAGLNGYGYVPQRGDENLLARFLFAEFSRSDNWRDMPAGAWSAVNRIRPNGHWPRYRTMDTIGTSLLDVLNKRGRDGTLQYSWLPPGGVGAPGGSHQWQASANPEALTGNDRQAWMWAVDTARRVLGGIDADRTGGATHFYNISVGDPNTVKGFFHNATRGPHATLTYSPYTSPNRQNFFLRTIEDPLRPVPWRPSTPPRR